MDAYVELFFTTPTIEEYFYGKPVVYGCEDHRLRVANNELQEERSRKAQALFAERQLQLRDLVVDAEKFDYSYGDIISDITELLLSGEKMERNPESLESSSKSLTTLFWNLGNWRRGENWRRPSASIPGSSLFLNPSIVPFVFSYVSFNGNSMGSTMVTTSVMCGSTALNGTFSKSKATTRRANQMSFQIMFQRTAICLCRCLKI